MSIALMNAVWDTDLPHARKLVALALADQANDAGECYPSIARIAKRCSMGERTVQDQLAALNAIGAITREFRKGSSTLYRIADPRSWRTGAGAAPPQEPHPRGAGAAPQPVREPHPTPAVPAPITTIEPKSKEQEQKKAREQVALPDWLPADAWEDWCEYRKGGRAKWTRRAQELTVAKLGRLRDEGHDPRTLIELAIERGWQGIHVPWSEAQPRAGPPQRVDRATSGVNALEQMKRGLAARGNSDGDAEADAPAPRQLALR